MSLLIRGMEMPAFEHQSWDIRRGADGKWYMVDTNAETSDGEWHEIVHVPPHGDLIDRDMLLINVDPEIHEVIEDSSGYCWECEWGYTREQIEAVPAILEAEEET